jgi:CRP/FNR family transcriptional regulator
MHSNAALRSYDAGNTIYSPFSQKQLVHVIERGYVLAGTDESDGKHRIHLIYGPGAYFPVITTFRNQPQRATYKALTPVTIAHFTTRGFLDKLDTDATFCRQILDKTVDQLAIFADRIIDLQLTALENKLLNRLQTLAHQHGTDSNEGRVLPYKLKHHQLADMMGVERESVSRSLQKLKQSGLIINHNDRIVIPFSD